MALPEKETPEIDHVENVVKVLAVDLKPHVHPVRFVDIGARGGIDLESRINSSASEVNAVHDGLSVCLFRPSRSVNGLLKSLTWVTLGWHWVYPSAIEK